MLSWFKFWSNRSIEKCPPALGKPLFDFDYIIYIAVKRWIADDVAHATICMMSYGSGAIVWAATQKMNESSRWLHLSMNRCSDYRSDSMKRHYSHLRSGYYLNCHHQVIYKIYLNWKRDLSCSRRVCLGIMRALSRCITLKKRFCSALVYFKSTLHMSISSRESSTKYTRGNISWVVLDERLTMMKSQWRYEMKQHYVVAVVYRIAVQYFWHSLDPRFKLIQSVPMPHLCLK